jgi:hypothetical protein
MKIISQSRFEHREHALRFLVREAVQGHQELAHQGQALAEHCDDGLGALRVLKEARRRLLQEALNEAGSHVVLLGLNLAEDTLEVVKDGNRWRYGHGIWVQGDEHAACKRQVKLALKACAFVYLHGVG